MLRKLLTPALYAIAAALLAAVGYWNINPDSFSERPAQAEAENAIDFYVINATTVQYQADGKLHYEMTSDKLEHVKRSDITLLTNPFLHLYRGTELPWKVNSARADAKGRPTILTTSRLTVIPDKEYAQTEQAVRIVAANGVTTAQGMKAYLNDGRMLLLSNVRGQHEVR